MARVLLAEADSPVRGLVAGVLADFGHDVTLCASRGEADARLRSTPIDVVVTDLVLRGVEGPGFGRRCLLLGIPTITLSGMEFRPDGAEPERPLPLCDKPFRFGDLQRMLDAVTRLVAGSAPQGGQRTAA
jgi:CheY-like chemotaxis protein